jgi:hypothetical protein
MVGLLRCRLGIALVTGMCLINTCRAQDSCTATPLPVDNMSNVHDDYLVLRSGTGTDYYLINAPCVHIDRQTFGTTLHFFLFNRLIKDKGLQSGTVYIRSYRTFSNTQYVNLKMSRGEGWYYPELGSKPIDGIFDVPFAGTVDTWDNLYATTGTPEDLNTKLSAPFHAYGGSDKTQPSTVPPAFWKSNRPFDQAHDVMTYYLIHFGVNPSAAVGLIPFYVALQPQVQHIKLSIFSNVETLSGDYEFIPN